MLKSVLSVRALLLSDVWIHTHKITSCFCTQSKSVCAALLLLHCSTTSNTHTSPNMLLLCVRVYVFVCACLISCSTLQQGTLLLCLWVTHFVITAATGGLFSENPHFLAGSANRHHLLLFCSNSSPHHSLLPALQFSEPGRADVRALSTAGQYLKQLEGEAQWERKHKRRINPLSLTTHTALNLLEIMEEFAEKHRYIPTVKAVMLTEPPCNHFFQHSHPQIL